MRARHFTASLCNSIRGITYFRHCQCWVDPSVLRNIFSQYRGGAMQIKPAAHTPLSATSCQHCARSWTQDCTELKKTVAVAMLVMSLLSMHHDGLCWCKLLSTIIAQCTAHLSWLELTKSWPLSFKLAVSSNKWHNKRTSDNYITGMVQRCYVLVMSCRRA